MEFIFYQVDAFSNKPFGGNPAGVIPDAKGLSEIEMQQIANEMNLSETAFVLKKNSTSFEVRFFTPKCEVDLCGHATIAAFYVLAQKGYINNTINSMIKINQITKAGKLPVEIYFKNNNVDKVLMYQSEPNSLGKIRDISILADILGIKAENIGLEDSLVYPEIISTGLPDIIVPVRDKVVLDNLNINMKKLEEYSIKLNVTGAHIFCINTNSSQEVYCRNFAPAVGINEEAATGTANGGLIYYLKRNNLLINNEIIAKQGQSMNRPSEIYCSIAENYSNYVVKVGGEARIVMEGVISI